MKLIFNIIFSAFLVVGVMGPHVPAHAADRQTVTFYVA